MENLLEEAYRRGKNARRQATAMSILDAAAMVGLFVGCLFWNIVFWRLIAPGDMLEMLLSVAFAGAYAIVLPMLLSLLAPSTPAGMMLAETRWKTIGHAISMAAAIFLTYHAFTVVLAWWQSRPAILETGQDLWMTIGALIIFIVVPALSWVQVAPDRWVAEIAQAQQVKRLKAAQQANIMAAQVQYARTMALLKRGLANATAAERSEVAHTLIAMQRAENEAIGQIADQMRIITGVDTGIPLLDDPQIERHYHQLTDSMERLIAPINDADYVEPAPLALSGERPRSTAVDRGPTAHEGRTMELPRSSVPRSDAETLDRTPTAHAPTADRHGPPRTAHASTAVDTTVQAAIDTARRLSEELEGAWARRDIERALSVEKTKAIELIRIWREHGLVQDITNPAHHYAWVREGA